MCHSKINKSLNQLQSQYLNCLNKHQLKTNETTEQISALKRSIKEQAIKIFNLIYHQQVVLLSEINKIDSNLSNQLDNIHSNLKQTDQRIINLKNKLSRINKNDSSTLKCEIELINLQIIDRISDLDQIKLNYDFDIIDLNENELKIGQINEKKQESSVDVRSKKAKKCKSDCLNSTINTLKESNSNTSVLNNEYNCSISLTASNTIDNVTDETDHSKTESNITINYQIDHITVPTTHELDNVIPCTSSQAPSYHNETQSKMNNSTNKIKNNQTVPVRRKKAKKSNLATSNTSNESMSNKDEISVNETSQTNEVVARESLTNISNQFNTVIEADVKEKELNCNSNRDINASNETNYSPDENYSAESQNNLNYSANFVNDLSQSINDDLNYSINLPCTSTQANLVCSRRIDFNNSKDDEFTQKARKDSKCTPMNEVYSNKDEDFIYMDTTLESDRSSSHSALNASNNSDMDVKRLPTPDTKKTYEFFKNIARKRNFD